MRLSRVVPAQPRLEALSRLRKAAADDAASDVTLAGCSDLVCEPEEGPMTEVLFDADGRRRSPATSPGFGAGRPPRNKGMRYPADPPTVEGIVAVMRTAGDRAHGRRLRALIVVLWRAGLRIHEAPALAESDLDQRRGSVVVRRGKGGRGREVGMDQWAWEQLEPWSAVRFELPVGPLFCVINGPTCGRPWSAAAARTELRRTAATAGVRRRFAPHQLRTPTRSRWHTKAFHC
jgi:integrase